MIYDSGSMIHDLCYFFLPYKKCLAGTETILTQILFDNNIAFAKKRFW